MIRLMNFAGEVLSAEALRDLDVRCPQGCWIDACEPDDGEITQLRSALALNDLALEDTLQRGHWSRFEQYPEHAFLIARTLEQPDQIDSPTERVSMFWTERVLLTMTNEKVPYLELVWRDCQRGRIDRPQQIVHDLLDHAADTFFVHADALHDYVDDLEEQVFDQTRRDDGSGFVRTVFDHKHRIMSTRRLVGGLSDATHGAARASGTEDALHFRDVHADLNRVSDLLDSSREVLASVLDVHLTVQSNRMNEVMKTLATVSTVFLPLTFLAGVWGMNFTNIPELDWRYGYAFAWTIMLMVAGALAAYFRRRGWW